MSVYVWVQSTYITDKTGSPVVLIYGRDTVTKQVRSFGVTGFKPYFYVEAPDGDVTSCFDTPLKKVTVNHPHDVAQERLKYERTFDADIPFDMRWLIDNGVYYAFDENMHPVDIPVMTPKICYYDIEINIDPNELPDPAKPDWPIVAISVLDSYKRKIRCFTLTDKKVHKSQVCCASEKELLAKFVDFVRDGDFDILTGWYNIGFDHPYIMNRAAKIGVNMNGLSRLDGGKCSDDRIPGRIVADMLELFKEWSKPLGQQSSYDLKSIAKNPLFGGFAYKDYGEHIRELIDGGDWKTLVQYSINDVISLNTIDEKCGLFKYFEGIRRLTGIKFEDCLMKTRIIEYFLMRTAGYPLPTRTRHIKEDFEGALVIQPTVGVKEFVAAADAAALYPTVIVAYNVSPDAFNIIPTTIVKMMDEREKLRAMRLRGEGGEILATTEQSLKYVINSFYGVMGYPSFKLFSQECAKFIPQKGQEIIKSIIAFIESKGYKVEYCDTDSAYFSVVKTVEEALSIEKEINDYLKQWAIGVGVKESLAPRIKIEKLYRKLFFKKSKTKDGAAKKRYAGHVIWKDGHTKNELDIKGFESKRSDNAAITRRTMDEFFAKLLIHDDEPGAIEFLKETYFAVRRGQKSLLECAIPKGVKSDVKSPHRRGMSNSEWLLGVPWTGHSKPMLLYCAVPAVELCITENNVDKVDTAYVRIDWPKQADKTIRDKMETIVESLGYKWETTIANQMTLADFM